ncbi:MAG: hypothetical protein AAFY88_29245, partial [Acidobacteriota bacterium]
MSAYLPLRARLRSILAGADVLGLVAATWCAYLLRFEGSLLGKKWRELVDNPGLVAWAIFAGLILAAAA